MNKSISTSDIQIVIENKYISSVKEIKFLGLIIDNTLSWKGHIDYIIPKLSSAYVIRTTRPYVSQNTLKIIYLFSFCNEIWISFGDP
jgi:hypothetical protein